MHTMTRENLKAIEFEKAVNSFLRAGDNLVEAWHEDSVKYYPAYLIRFDEFMMDLAKGTANLRQREHGQNTFDWSNVTTLNS